MLFEDQSGAFGSDEKQAAREVNSIWFEVDRMPREARNVAQTL